MSLKNFPEILQKNGFTKNESLVYLSILKRRETTVTQAAHDTRIKRTTAYNTIQALKSRGLVSINSRKNTQFITATSPHFLVDEITKHAKMAHSILPGLMELANAGGRMPKVQFFDGIEGVKNCYQQVKSDEILGFTNYRNMSDEVYYEIFNTVIPSQKKNNVKARFLMPENEENRKVSVDYDDGYFVHHRFFPSLAETLNIEFYLCNEDDIFFVSFSQDEVFGIHIQSKNGIFYP